MVYFLTELQVQELYPELDSTDLTAINLSIKNRIEEYCNTSFEPMEYTGERYDSYTEIMPEHRPIISVEKLVDAGTTLTEDSDFYVYPNIVSISSPTQVRKAISIDYTAGYSIVPELVKVTALEILRFRKFKETEGSLLFYKQQTFEERTYEFDPSISEEEILSTLDSYVQSKERVKQSGRKSGLRIGYMN